MTEREISPPSKMTMLVLLTSGTPVALGMTCLIPVLPKIEDALANHSSDTYLVKFVSVAMGLGMVAGAPLAGWLSDKIGRRPVLIACLIAFSIFGMMGYFLHDLYSLIISRIFVGVAAAAVLTTGVTLVGDYFEGPRRNGLMGLNATVSSISALLGTPIAGFIGEISWQAPFLIHGIGLPMAGLALTLTGTKNHSGDARKVVSEPRQPFPYGLVAMSIVAGIIIFAPTVYIPFRMRDLGFNSPTTIAFVLTAKSIAVAVIAASYGKARARLSINQTFMASFMLCALGTAAFALVSSYELMLLSALVFGLGMGWVAPNLMTAAANAATEATRGRVMGIVKGANLISSLLAVVLLEPISNLRGPDAALLTVTLMSTGMLAICLYSDSRASRSLCRPSC